jgi:AraC-like DNA-binding protein
MGLGKRLGAVFEDADFLGGIGVRTPEIEQARKLGSQILRPHRLRIPRGSPRLDFTAQQISVEQLLISRVTWRAAVSIDSAYLEDCYLLTLPISGSAEYCIGGTAAITDPEHPVIVGGIPQFSFNATADYCQVVVAIERAWVEQTWLALSNTRVNAPIQFVSAISVNSDAWPAIRSALTVVKRIATGELNSTSIANVAAHARRNLVMALLLNQPHSQISSQKVDSREAPYYLRRCKAMMLDRIEDRITLEDLAQELGVSMRTLQWAFNKCEGRGPIQWLREQRLLAVRRVLISSDGRRPFVSEVALRFGFGHLGTPRVAGINVRDISSSDLGCNYRNVSLMMRIFRPHGCSHRRRYLAQLKRCCSASRRTAA